MKSITMGMFKKKLSSHVLEAVNNDEPLEVNRMDGNNFIVIPKKNWLSYEKAIQLLLGENIVINKN